MDDSPGRERGIPPIAGWAPPSDVDGRPAHGVSDLLLEAVGAYRRRWRPLLILSLLTEGLVTLIALPYTITAGSQTLDLLGAFGQTTGASRPLALPRLMTDPALAALGGVLSVVPLAGTLILIASVTALLLAPQPEAHTWRGALSRALEHRLSILGPVVALSVFAALVQVLVSGLAAPINAIGGNPQQAVGQMAAFALLLLLLAPALLIAAIYLAVRWAVAVPALVMEAASLRRSLARSVMLTRRRTLLVGLSLLAVYGLTSIVAGIAWTITLVGSGWAMPLVLLPVAFHLAIRVVLAPLGAIVPALLYRELRLASDGATPAGRSTNAGPDPRRSAGVP